MTNFNHSGRVFFTGIFEVSMKAPTSKLERTLNELSKLGLSVRMGSEIKSSMDFVPTGSLMLQEAIGRPGYPCGLITEIYGKKSAGKSLLALVAEGYVTRAKKYVLHLDLEKNHEHFETNEWREVFGIDLDYVIQIDTSTAETAMEGTITAIERMGKDLKLIVCDSIAALTPEKVLKSEMGDATQPGNQAKLIHKWFDLLRAKNKYAAFLAINQITARIGGYGSPETKSGGFAMEFDPHLSLEVKSKSILAKDSDENGSSGLDMQIQIKKNKIGPAHKIAFLKFQREFGGFDILEEIIELSRIKSLVKVTAPWYYFGDKNFKGREDFKKYLGENKKVLRNLIKELGYNPNELL